MRLQTTRSRSLALVAGIACCVPGALAWGAAGHEIVATIAQIYTEPVVLDRLCQILRDDNTIADFDDEIGGSATTEEAAAGPCRLASIATWADRYKYRMRWSAPLHYVGGVGDHPADICLFPGPNGWAGSPNINVLGGIYNTSNILFDWATGASGNIGLAQEALKFIVHFVGDLHMPLHLTGRDRGGNQVDVCWDGRRTNLHSAWDTYIPSKAIRNVGSNYSRPLPFERVERNLHGAIYDPLIRRIIWEGTEDKWADELQDWVGCPGATEIEDTQNTKSTVRQTLLDFFLSGWFTRTNEAPMTDNNFICPYHWAKPINALNCELIWPKALDEDPSLLSQTAPRRARCKRHRDWVTGGEEVFEADTGGEPPYELDNPDYMGAIEERMLLEQFLAQGGIRLATILNYLFGAGSNVDRIVM